MTFLKILRRLHCFTFIASSLNRYCQENDDQRNGRVLTELKSRSWTRRWTHQHRHCQFWGPSDRFHQSAIFFLTITTTFTTTTTTILSSSSYSSDVIRFTASMENGDVVFHHDHFHFKPLNSLRCSFIMPEFQNPSWWNKYKLWSYNSLLCQQWYRCIIRDMIQKRTII